MNLIEESIQDYENGSKTEFFYTKVMMEKVK